MENGTKWVEDLRVAVTIIGVLLLVGVMAAAGVRLLLGF